MGKQAEEIWKAFFPSLKNELSVSRTNSVVQKDLKVLSPA